MNTKTVDYLNGKLFPMILKFSVPAALLVSVCFPDFFLGVFGVSQTAYPYALSYYRIVACGYLFQGLSQLFCDFVRVSGKLVMGMCVTGLGAAANIVLDALFIIAFDWGGMAFSLRSLSVIFWQPCCRCI